MSLSASILLSAIVLLFVFWAVGAYNRLAKLREHFKNLFAPIDALVKRRHDLIPNLVEVVHAYMKQERDALEAVIGAHNRAIAANLGVDSADAPAVRRMAGAEAGLTADLGRMFALAYAHPELLTSPNLKQITDEMIAIENSLIFARQAYNASVLQYNASLEQFPGSLIARMFAFKSGAALP